MTGRERLAALEKQVAVLAEHQRWCQRQIEKLLDIKVQRDRIVSAEQSEAWLDEDFDPSTGEFNPDEEPPVSNTVGGSTDEQKAEYKAFVEQQQAKDLAERGIEMDGDTVVLAPPTAQQRLMRLGLAKRIGWEHWRRDPKGNGGDPLPETDAIEAYVKGGPLWLYFYDREFVLEQPVNVRQAMCDDAQLTSVEAGRELSADILMDRTEEATAGTAIAYDNADSQWRHQ